MIQRVQPDRRHLLVLLALLAAGCAEMQEGLHDVGKVRATFYRHHMEATGSPVEMPGRRLVPQSRCGSGTEDGLFDPCRPEGQPVELDAWGMPKTPRGPWPAQAGRATTIPLPPPLPARRAVSASRRPG